MTIVYETNTGSAEQYAELLSQRTGYQAMSLKKALSALDSQEEIIFIGWVMAGTVQGLARAKEYFTSIRAVCSVGITLSEKNTQELMEKNGITEGLFSLRGNFHIEKLSGMYKMMMNMMLKMIKSKLKEKSAEEGDRILGALETGIDGVEEEQLSEVIAYLSQEG